MSPVELESDDILLRARRLDSNVLGQLHDLYYPEVYRYICYRMPDPPACETIASGVFIEYLEAINRGRAPRRNLLGWLLNTASTLVEARLRQRSDLPMSGPGQDLQPVHQLEQVLRPAIQKLSSEQQHFLALRFSKNRTIEQVARIMGKPVNELRGLQYHTLSSLKLFVERRGAPAQR